MNKLILTPLTIALSLTLSACGGSSSDNNSIASSIGDNTSQGQKISLKTVSYQCSVDTAYQTDVVFHNADGDAISSIKTDVQGNFSGELPRGTKHISVLGDVTDLYDGDYKQIYTELDIENRTNLGTFYFNRDKENCGCKEYSIDKTDLITITADQGYQISDSVTICPSQDKLYLTALSRYSADAKAAIIDIPKNSSVIKLSDDNFSYDGVEVSLKSSFGADYFSTRGYIEAENSFQLVQYVFADGQTPLYIFPTATQNNFYVQLRQSESAYIDNVRIETYSYARSGVNNDGSYQLTELPIVNDQLGFSLTQFAENEASSYDFSDVDNRFGRIELEYSFLVGDAAESRFDWLIRGGISGEIPDLSFGSIFPEPKDNVVLEELNLFLYGYAGNATDANSYAKLLDAQSEGGHLTKPEFNNYVYISVEAQLD